MVGKEGALEGGGGLGEKIIENYVMDGQKDNDVISTAYRCLLLRPISIVSGAFGQTRRKGGGGSGDGYVLNLVSHLYHKSLKHIVCPTKEGWFCCFVRSPLFFFTCLCCTAHKDKRARSIH